MRALGIAAIAIGILLVAGHLSGNQPERDSVAAARAETGIGFEARFVDVGEVELHVVSAGPEEGAPVVLLHGFPEFWYAWRGPAAVLARAGFRVIVPDQRGYNLSDKPSGVESYQLRHLVGDVVGLLDALGIERAALGVQDWGGAVGWRMAIEHPERLSHLAVIDTPHPFAEESGEEETTSWYQTFIQLPWIPGYTARLGNWRLLTSSLRNSSAPGTFSEEELDQLRSAWARDDAIHRMADWYRASPWPIEGDARVRVPTRVLLAAHDEFIPTSATRSSMEFVDDGKLVELGFGTHWVSAEEPERIGAVLAGFFGESPSRVSR